MLTKLTHKMIAGLSKKSYLRFKAKNSSVQEEQLKILARLVACSHLTQTGSKKNLSAGLSDKNLKEFQAAYQPATYLDYENLIMQQRQSGAALFSTAVERYQPTSGSTSARKWIPYTKELAREFDNATLPWLHDIYLRHPEIAAGPHYWSLSWIPNELRALVKSQDDLEVFPWWQKLMLRKIMAVPGELARADNAHAAQMATLSWLVSHANLTLLFVWSPTFMLGLLDILKKNAWQISEILETGQWGPYANELKNVPAPKNSGQAKKLKSHWTLGGLWPKLRLISAWENSYSKPWADLLKNQFPQVPFQGKGLFATEGVVTIPFENKYPLAYLSHFYEFECLETKKIMLAHQLEEGQKVSPLLSTGSGFFRLRLGDQMLVQKHWGRVPCLEFISRLNTLDLVGEKISFELAEQLLSELEKSLPGIQAVSLAAVKGNTGIPFYMAVVQGAQKDVVLKNKIETLMEDRLKNNYHYALARDLGQLGPATALVKLNVRQWFEEYAAKKGMLNGEIKIEPLLYLENFQEEI